MSQNIEFNKQVFNKTSYEKVIDTSFKQLGVKSINEKVEKQPTVNDFFRMYNELFYDINEKGPTNSHEYLIQQSSEYVNFEQSNEEIEALQEEIAQLRIDLLEAEKSIIELQTNTNLDQ